VGQGEQSQNEEGREKITDSLSCGNRGNLVVKTKRLEEPFERSSLRGKEEGGENRFKNGKCVPGGGHRVTAHLEKDQKTS